MVLKALGTQLTCETLQVVLSHTPYRQLVKHLGDRPVLISGRGNFHHVAREYGFTQSVTTAQLARALPDALPMSQQEADGINSTRQQSQSWLWYMACFHSPCVPVLVLQHDGSCRNTGLEAGRQSATMTGIP